MGPGTCYGAVKNTRKRGQMQAPGQPEASCYLAAIAHQGRGSSPWAAGTLPTCSYQTRTVTRDIGSKGS